ncbi:ferritin [Bacillus changyiensis]|uniref:ferritin n=1 Tax=Bacillus changyiensis TaxID=3004103 RepID=UPI0022E8A367|nr:ferritin [Bacillus changyiensis]MDA1475160.1 ferritin [Bacillus changyiensis]
MISDRMQQLINNLIQIEYQSAYLYLAMSNYFNRLNLTGIGHWFRVQHDEERGHALKLIDYLTDRNGVVQIKNIPEQPINFGNTVEAFQKVLAHEQYVTENYRQAYTIAQQEGDQQSIVIFLEFLREQTEEEAQTITILERFQLAGNNASAVLLLDQELGQREPVDMTARGQGG